MKKAGITFLTMKTWKIVIANLRISILFFKKSENAYEEQ